MSLESCMDVPELMKKLNKKPASQENEAKKEDETAGNLRHCLYMFGSVYASEHR